MAQRSSVSESIRGSQSRVSVDLKGLEREKLGDLPCVAEGLGKLESDLPPKVTMEEVDAQQTERSALSSGFGRPYLKALKVGTGGESALEDSGSPVADEDAESPNDEAVLDAKGLKAIVEPVTGSQTHEDPNGLDGVFGLPTDGVVWDTFCCCYCDYARWSGWGALALPTDGGLFQLGLYTGTTTPHADYSAKSCAWPWPIDGELMVERWGAQGREIGSSTFMHEEGDLGSYMEKGELGLFPLLVLGDGGCSARRRARHWDSCPTILSSASMVVHEFGLSLMSSARAWTRELGAALCRARLLFILSKELSVEVVADNGVQSVVMGDRCASMFGLELLVLTHSLLCLAGPRTRRGAKLVCGYACSHGVVAVGTSLCSGWEAQPRARLGRLACS
ncbi:hypothetical protein Dimus_033137 [Dionaea muscipula]